MKSLSFCAAVIAAAIAPLASANAQTQPSEADKAAEQKIVQDAQKRVCDELKDCRSAIFRFGKTIRQGNGPFVACGEVNSKNGFGGYTGFEIWLLPVGALTPPYLEEIYPQFMRDQMHSGPCAQPNPGESAQPTPPTDPSK
jgi:hypothetical protein